MDTFITRASTADTKGKGVFRGDKHTINGCRVSELGEWRRSCVCALICSPLVSDTVRRMHRCPCSDANNPDERDLLNVRHLAFIERRTSHSHVTPLAASLQTLCTSTASTTSSERFLFPSNCGRNVRVAERRGFHVCHLCARMHRLPNDCMCACSYI